jgi:hypothetical protein
MSTYGDKLDRRMLDKILYIQESSPVQSVTKSYIFKRQARFACCVLHACILLDLLVNPEDGSSMFLLNVGGLLTDYKTLIISQKTPKLVPLITPRHGSHRKHLSCQLLFSSST